jgi:hypothetical protein
LADQTTQQLADLVAQVFPPLPFDASARPVGQGSSAAQPVTVERRSADRYVARWRYSAPTPGEDIEVFVAHCEAVYSLTARVTGIDDKTARYLTITELRRKTQRRTMPRGPIEELVLISHEGDVDGTMIDVSGQGLSFHLDRPLPVGASIRAVINFDGRVIPTTATVRHCTQDSDDRYRVGCAITNVAPHHQDALNRHATTAPLDRRTPPHDGHVRGFLHKFGNAA